MSNSDKHVYLQPGQQGYPVRAGGDFIFLKDAPRPVRVIVDGQPITMRPGAKRRFERQRPGEPAFDQFEVDNLNDDLPISVTFVVGKGDYEEQIIRGEILAVTGVQRADGTYVTDRRYWRQATMDWRNRDYQEFSQGEQIGGTNSSVAGNGWGGWVVGKTAYIHNNAVYSSNTIQVVDLETHNILEERRFSEPNLFDGSASPGLTHHDQYAGQLLVTQRVSGGGNNVYTGDYAGNLVLANQLFDSIPPEAGQELGALVRDPLTGKYIEWWTSSSAGNHGVRVDGQYTKLTDFVGSGLTSTVGIYSSLDGKTRWFMANWNGAGNTQAWYLDDVLAGQFVSVAASEKAGLSGSSYWYPQINAPWLRSAVYDQSARVLAVEDHAKSGKAYVTEGVTSQVLRPESFDVFGEFAFTSDGSDLYAEGPIVKAALHGLMGEEPPPDYLDHVFYVEMTPGDRGTPKTVKTSGSETWSAANFADDFKVKLPVTLNIQTDL